MTNRVRDLAIAVLASVSVVAGLASAASAKADPDLATARQDGQQAMTDYANSGGTVSAVVCGDLLVKAGHSLTPGTYTAGFLQGCKYQAQRILAERGTYGR